LTKAHVTESIAKKNKVTFWMLDLTAFWIWPVPGWKRQISGKG
ncbi:unnamed protein product, partial [marine sediment metagenome]